MSLLKADRVVAGYGAHDEILKGRGTWLHATARWVDYGGKWIFLAPAMLLLFGLSRAARRHWWLWCALMPIGGAVEQSFKFLVGRPRPRGRRADGKLLP